MSDWKSRATPVEEHKESPSTNDWKSRAVPHDENNDSMSDKIENTLSNLNPTDLRNKALGAIPGIGDSLKSVMESQDAAKKALIHSGTLGFSDEIEGAVKGAGRTALEAATGELPKDKSTLQELLDNYRKYQKNAENDIKKSDQDNPISSLAGSLVGSGITAGAALTPAATLPARLGTMTALGAAEGAGKTENNENLRNNITTGAAIGLLGGGIGEAAAPLIGKGAESLIKYGQGNEYLKQLAATLKNSSEGGTLFSQGGKQKVAQQMEDFASKSADDIVKNLLEKNKLYEQAFKEASESGATIEPNSALLQSQSEAIGKLQNASIKLPPNLMEGMQKLQNGSLNPQEAYLLIRQLNEIKFNKTMPKTPEFESLGNFADELTQATNETLPSTTLENLNLQKSTAHKAVEPFLQGAGHAEFEPNKFVNQSSDYGQNQLRSKIKDYFGSNLERVGEGTARGTEFQNQLSKGEDYFKGLQEKAPLSTDFNKILGDTQQLGYLNAARRSTSGIHTESGKPLDKLGQVVNSVMSSPYRAAEVISGSKTAQDVSKALLMGDKETTGSVAERLLSNPATKHLGESLANPRNQTHLNQTIFTIMQNPTAKEIMGIGPEDQK